MRKAMFLLLLLTSMTFDEVKRELTTCKSLLEVNEKDADAHYRLALAYFFDQELDLAFEHFLKALDYVKRKESWQLDENEKATAAYISQSGNDPIRAATELLARYKNDDSLQARFVLSLAYANLGQYATFFTDFYEGFAHYSETFLAYKIRGILALRLAQHDTETHYKDLAFEYLTKALESYPFDPSLYKVLIFLAKDEKNDALMSHYLQKVVDHHVKVARSDIYLYVREAVTLDMLEVAKQLIAQAKEHYEFSRAISAAEDYLTQHQGGL